MFGNPDFEKKKGIIPRALEDIFRETKQNIEFSYEIKIGYIQIYMEMV